MRKEMESLQLRANNSLTLLKDMFKGQTVHKGKAQQNRGMKENARMTKKNKEARFKVAAERLLEEITSEKILDTCFPNDMSVKAQWPIAVPSEVSRDQQKIIAFSTAQATEKRCHIIGRERYLLPRGEEVGGGNFSVASVQSRKRRRRPTNPLK